MRRLLFRGLAWQALRAGRITADGFGLGAAPLMGQESRVTAAKV